MLGKTGTLPVKIRDRLLFYLSHFELARNKKFKNLHKGETCYIFGNGVSLKNVDFNNFKDKISIGCNSLFFHNSFKDLNCKYYQIPAPLFFYPYRKYYGKFQKNYIYNLYKKKIDENPDTAFFTDISNSLNCRRKNIYYTHHFGNKKWELDKNDMGGIFSFMEGATCAMLGTAMYLGFESAVLVGMDYAFTPQYSHHFFEKGVGIRQESLEPNHVYAALLNALQEKISLTIMTPSGKQSSLLKNVQYETFCNSNSVYYENCDIVDGSILEDLNKQGFYNIY